MKSSRKPTRPSPTNRKSSSSAEADGRRPGDQLGRRSSRRTVARMMTRPPMVGVPRLVWWRGRAVVADLLAVAPCVTAAVIATRVPSSEMSRESPPPNRIALMAWSLLRRSGPVGRAARRRRTSSAAPRDALTRTTSPAATFSRSHASASSRPAVATATPVQPAPRAAPSAMAAGRRADRDQHVDAERRPRRRPPRRCSRRASARRARASRRARRRCAGRCAPPIAGQRLERGAHRVGVGVVGVVDDDQAVGALVRAPSASGDGRPRRGQRRRRPRPSGSPTASAMARPRPRRWRPGGRPSWPSRTGAPARRRTPARRRAGRGRRARRARQVTSPRAAEGERRARRCAVAIAATSVVVGVEHRDAVGGQRLDDLALGLRDRLPASRTRRGGRCRR